MCGVMWECACVTLAAQHGAGPVVFDIQADNPPSPWYGLAKWVPPAGAIVQTYRQTNTRIERAAECIALAVLRSREGLVVVQQALSGSGGDWVVSTGLNDLENLTLVEVSGVEAAGSTELHARLLEKVEQLRRPEERTMPGRAIVVGVGDAMVLTRDVPLAADVGAQHP
jgi:hypothetical protein